FVRCEFASEHVEQLAVVRGGRSAGDGVERLDQTGAEEIGPDAVDCVASEVRIVRRCHPFGERGPCACVLFPRWLPAIEESGLDHFLGAGHRDFVFLRVLVAGQQKILQALRLDPGKEGGEAPELLALPFRERMVMALGALDTDAEEYPGRAGGEIL